MSLELLLTDASAFKNIQVVTPEICLAAVKLNSATIKYMLDTYITDEICGIAMDDDIRNIRFIPTSVQDKWIQKYPNAVQFMTTDSCIYHVGITKLEYVPSKYITDEIASYAIDRDPSCIRYVSTPTAAMCKTAIMYDSKLIEYIPYSSRTKHLCDMVLNDILHGFCSKTKIEFIPKKYLSARMYYKLLKHDKIPADLIADEYQNESFYMGCVDKCCKILGHIPVKFLTESMIRCARDKAESRELEDLVISIAKMLDLSNYKRILGIVYKLIDIIYVPSALQMYEICYATMMKNPESIDCMLTDCNLKGDVIDAIGHWTFMPMICGLAIIRNNAVIRYVPDKYLTEMLCLTALKSSLSPLRQYPHKIKMTRTIALLVVNGGEPADLSYTIIKDMSLSSKYGVCADYYFDKTFTKRLIRIAVERNGLALKYVPDEYKTPDICLIAVSQNGLALKYINHITKTWIYPFDKYKKRSISDDICIAALRQNGKAIGYIQTPTATMRSIALHSKELYLSETHKLPWIYYKWFSETMPYIKKNLYQARVYTDMFIKMPG
jgi:hypothetical protein